MKKIIIFILSILIILSILYQVNAENGYQTSLDKNLKENGQFKINNEKIIQLQDNVFNITNDDAVMGNPAAPVTMVEFGGFEETFSRRFWKETFPTIKAQYIDTDKVKFIFRDFPLVELFPSDGIAAVAAECVRLQGGNNAYFQMWNALYATDQVFDDEVIQRIALNIGYNIADCLESGTPIYEVVLDITDAFLLGVEGSPTFFINDQIVSGAQPYNIFQDIIEQELNESVVCFNNSQCNDANTYTYDTCINPGRLNAECKHQQIRCVTGLDCGSTTIANSCSGDNVCIKITYPVCNNPGTPQSSCSSSFSNSCHICEFRCNNQTLRCTEAPVIIVNSPLSHKNYNTKSIQINLSIGNYVFDEILYMDRDNVRPRWITLCKNCNEYGVKRKITKIFSDGLHTLKFRAEKGNISISNEIFFFVDNKPPRILRTEPRSNSFTNGSNFYIRYTEDNCQSLKLNIYGNNMSSINTLFCLSGENIEKEFFVNLNSYNNQEVEYQFVIKDIANNTAESRKTKIKLDTVHPLINSFVNTTNGKRVTFILNVTEPNFDEVNYIDWNDLIPIERILCSSLRNRICRSTKTFRLGDHNITIHVYDKAGNDASVNTRFFI